MKPTVQKPYYLGKWEEDPCNRSKMVIRCHTPKGSAWSYVAQKSFYEKYTDTCEYLALRYFEAKIMEDKLGVKE